MWRGLVFFPPLSYFIVGPLFLAAAGGAFLGNIFIFLGSSNGLGQGRIARIVNAIVGSFLAAVNFFIVRKWLLVFYSGIMAADEAHVARTFWQSMFSSPFISVPLSFLEPMAVQAAIIGTLYKLSGARRTGEGMPK